MREDYTPTTDDVRTWYMETYSGPDGRRGLAFDRWLAKRDAEVAAKAWAEGYKLTPMTDNVEMVEILNPYRKEKSE